MKTPNIILNPRQQIKYIQNQQLLHLTNEKYGL
jgi:hypothetical protein